MSAIEEKENNYGSKSFFDSLAPWSSSPEKFENLHCQHMDLSGSKSSNPTFMETFYDRKITMALMVSILFGMSIITLFILLHPNVYLQKYNSDVIKQGDCVREEKSVVMYNGKIKDFQCLHPEVKELHIVSLESMVPDLTEDFKEKVFLYNLTLSGAISEKWLHYFVIKFPNLKSLKYNENNLCDYSLLGRNPDLFPVHTFPQLKTLVVENANSKCPLTKLVFAKWSTPVLENFKIENSDLNQVLFSYCHAFLTRFRNTLQVVEIINSFLCNDCDFMNIDFQNLDKIRINPKEFDFDWDVHL